jgi:hypothetical protein
MESFIELAGAVIHQHFELPGFPPRSNPEHHSSQLHPAKLKRPAYRKLWSLPFPDCLSIKMFFSGIANSFHAICDLPCKTKKQQKIGHLPMFPANDLSMFPIQFQ